MTNEEAKEIIECREMIDAISDRSNEALDIAIKALDQEAEAVQFVKWVTTEIFDDNWEYNKDAFAEIACRKLAKLGIVRENGDKWELVEQQKSEDNYDARRSNKNY